MFKLFLSYISATKNYLHMRYLGANHGMTMRYSTFPRKLSEAETIRVQEILDRRAERDKS